MCQSRAQGGRRCASCRWRKAANKRRRLIESTPPEERSQVEREYRESVCEMASKPRSRRALVERLAELLCFVGPAAFDDGEVMLADLTVAQHAVQLDQGRPLLGNHQKTGAVAVEPVGELEKPGLWPRGAQRLDYAEADAAAAVDRDAGGLVDDQEGAVLVDDREFGGLRPPMSLGDLSVRASASPSDLLQPIPPARQRRAGAQHTQHGQRGRLGHALLIPRPDLLLEGFHRLLQLVAFAP